MNNKLILKNDIICICIAILILTFATLCSPLYKTKSDNNQSSEDISTEEISVYNTEYVDIDNSIIHNIKTYINENYDDMLILAIHTNHTDANTQVIVSLASTTSMDRVYDYTFKKIEYLDNKYDKFYEVSDISNWKYIVNKVKDMSINIYNNSNIDFVDSFNLSIIDEKDYETIWITVDNKGNILYDILHEYYKSE